VGKFVAEKPKFWLRRLESKDIETVASFECEIAKISFPDDPITELSFYAQKLTRLVGDKNAAAIVAEDHSGVVGWAHVSKRRNFITKEAYGDFHSIYIGPSQRGTGVAAELVNAVFEFCRQEKLQRVVFRTRATNERMKAVLARFGFLPTQIYYERMLDRNDSRTSSESSDS
jgi:RimJ/RimL family protein N-acetyltransferase